MTAPAPPATTSASRSSPIRRSRTSRPLTGISPNPKEFERNVDFFGDTEAPEGDVTAPLTAVDLQVPLLGTSTSGGDSADFAGFPAGSLSCSVGCATSS